MPSKGKNRASKQSQLKNRRKRGGTSNVVDSRPKSKVSPEKTATPNPENANINVVDIEISPKKVTKSSISSLKYPYLKGELIRIAAVSILIVLILISFTFIPLE